MAKAKIKKVEDFYKLGTWGGMVKYMCAECAFDSLEKGMIEAHIRDRHMPQPPKAVVIPKFYNRFGKEMLRDKDGKLILK